MRRDADWNHYEYRYEPSDGEGHRTAYVRFDVGCALMPAPASHGNTLRLAVAEADAARLDEVVWQLPDAAWWVGEERFAGRYVAVLQVDEPDAVEAEARRLGEGLSLSAQRSAGWDYFEDRVCPSEHAWRRITDREQLQRLGGRDLQAPCPIAHAFYGSSAGIGTLREELVGQGFACDDGGPDDRLVARKEHAPSAVSELSVPLMRIAARHGCAYDGWTL